MKRNKVESSNLESIGYDEDTRTLEIEFKGKNGKSNSLYQYSPISYEGYLELIKSESVGKTFYQRIKINPSIKTLKIEFTIKTGKNNS